MKRKETPAAAECPSQLPDIQALSPEQLLKIKGGHGCCSGPKGGDKRKRPTGTV